MGGPVRNVARFDPIAVVPDRRLLFARLIAPLGDPSSHPLGELLDSAVETCVEMAEPRGMWEAIAAPAFQVVYGGQGLNTEPTPLEEVVPRAKGMALFVVTLGQRLSAQIERLLRDGHPPEALLLWEVASIALDESTERLGRAFRDHLAAGDGGGPLPRVLPYYPGWCGWDMSGRRAVFERLAAKEIGVAITASYEIQPAESRCGVLVAGSLEAHRHRMDYPACRYCVTHSCRRRMVSMLAS